VAKRRAKSHSSPFPNILNASTLLRGMSLREVNRQYFGTYPKWGMRFIGDAFTSSSPGKSADETDGKANNGYHKTQTDHQG
jgi:hypothetical protein